ncbi:YciI family protein [Hymenobacter sp. BT635]|uniref:YciI family protein n=1 Tax=Hymenobacter nitidus TaxID=2880929 RepID=A0ABS8AD21_9BACT|nr:YciI family protein [Hymenobacter nitidus]MCB2378300.1 YciI family protein [Hymenobacter nitidus]
MKKHGFLLLTLVLGLGSLPVAAQSEGRAAKRQAAAKTYYLVLLKNGTAKVRDMETVSTIRAGHAAHLQQLTRQGRLTLAGRCPGPKEKSALGGMYILQAQSLEEARRLTETDPAVQAGSLTMEIYPWVHQELGGQP